MKKKDKEFAQRYMDFGIIENYDELWELLECAELACFKALGKDAPQESKSLFIFAYLEGRVEQNVSTLERCARYDLEEYADVITYIAPDIIDSIMTNVLLPAKRRMEQQNNKNIS